jgi:hypothetical protein
MKTFLVNSLFVIPCYNGVRGQTMDISARNYRLNKALDFKNNHGFSGKDERFEMQHTELPRTTMGNKFKFALTDVRKLDSTVFERWDSTANQLVVSRKALYSYDANGNKTSVTGYSRNDSTKQFIPDFKEEYEYDALGNNTLFTSKVWNESASQWFTEHKKKSNYDANGNKGDLQCEIRG